MKVKQEEPLPEGS
jgi:hypothetical protein